MTVNQEMLWESFLVELFPLIGVVLIRVHQGAFIADKNFASNAQAKPVLIQSKR